MAQGLCIIRTPTIGGTTKFTASCWTKTSYHRPFAGAEQFGVKRSRTWVPVNYDSTIIEHLFYPISRAFKIQKRTRE